MSVLIISVIVFIDYCSNQYQPRKTDMGFRYESGQTWKHWLVHRRTHKHKAGFLVLSSAFIAPLIPYNSLKLKKGEEKWLYVMTWQSVHVKTIENSARPLTGCVR